MSARQATKSGKLSDQQKKNLAVAAFVVLGGGLMVFQLRDLFFGGAAPAPAAAPVILNKPVEKPTAGAGATVAAPPGFAVGEARKVGTASTLLDPTLHMEAMLVTESLVYTGKGRNIFSASAAPVELPTAVQHNRKPIPLPVQPVRIVDQGPPPPPPINLKFFGTATRGSAATGDLNRRAFLLHGEDVFLASAGDIVDRRYKVISIAATSIVVEDMPNNNRQTLPLQAN
jgi:hypothetical protein